MELYSEMCWKCWNSVISSIDTQFTKITFSMSKSLWSYFVDRRRVARTKIGRQADSVIQKFILAVTQVRSELSSHGALDLSVASTLIMITMSSLRKHIQR